MKKWICLILSLIMLTSILSACGAPKPAETAPAAETPAPEADTAWDREGYFQDENGNFLSITWMEVDGAEGWYVGLMLGENSYGNFIVQEGDSLHGDVTPDYEEGEMIVTVTREGDDGLTVTTADSTYHFTAIEVPEAAFMVSINTEGLGWIAYAPQGEEPVFDEEYPWTSTHMGLAGPETYEIAARGRDDWTFEKWTLNGEDYSTEDRITVEFTEDTDLVAVFTWSGEEESGQNPVMNFVGYYSSVRPTAFVECWGLDGARITVRWGSSAWETSEWIMEGFFDESDLTVEYSDAVRYDRVYNDDGSVKSETVAYEDGTGVFRFGEDGTMTWEDEKENQAEGIVFTFDPELRWADADWYESVTAMPKSEVEELCRMLRQAYLEEDWEYIADWLRYPFALGETEFETTDEFITYMQSKTIHASDREAMEAETCCNMFVNGDGICMGSGQIWLNDMNYMTDEEPMLEIVGLSGIVDR